MSSNYRGGTSFGPLYHDDDSICTVARLSSWTAEVSSGSSSHTSYHLLIWLAGGDGVCVAVLVVLPGEPGRAMGIENPGAPGVHASNGSTLIIMPSLRIIIDGKRMLTWRKKPLSALIGF